eukprot:1159332-Pelagomonas_calceolata.AAC.11
MERRLPVCIQHWCEARRGARCCHTDRWVQVTHFKLLCSDELTLTANDPNAMQAVLNCLGLCTQRKHLVINTANSEAVKRKEKSTPAQRPRALRKGYLTSKLESVSPKGPQT